MPQANKNQPESKRKNKSEAAKWYPDDVEALINTLYTNLDKYRTDENSASFKPAVWTVVAAKLAELHDAQPEKDEKDKGKGGPKTARACSDKWKTVRHILVSLCHTYTHIFG